MPVDTDILIVGGGLVGVSLAVALGQAGLNVAVVEPRAFTQDDHASYDERSIALAQGSQRIFSGMGVWEALADQLCPIHTIHASDRGHFGFTRLTREQEGVAALGYVASARILSNVLLQRASEIENIQLYTTAKLASFTAGAHSVEASIEQSGKEIQLTARLLVAADGAESAIREKLSIDTLQRSYGQTAIVANVSTDLPHKHIAYERFTDTGPMALLPMTDQRCALVWTVLSDQSDELIGLSDAEFLQRLQARFGYRLGRFEKVGKRSAFPLQLVKASETIGHRMALIGNAVHTLHPIAGQGFNLGLRDVAVLAEVVMDAHRDDQDIGELNVLERYSHWRQGDQRRVVTFTDGLVRLYTQAFPPVVCLRNAGMLAMDLCPPAKRWFGRLTMGRAGRQPRLARGLDV